MGGVVMLLIPLCFFYFGLHKLVVTNAGGRHLVMLRVQGKKGEQSKTHLLLSIREGQVQNE